VFSVVRYRKSPKTATVAEKWDCRRIWRLSPLSRRFLSQSPFSATVALFCDSVDRALHTQKCVLHIHVFQFHALQIGPSFSSPAISFLKHKMLFIHADFGLPVVRNPGAVPCIICFSERYGFFSHANNILSNICSLRSRHWNLKVLYNIMRVTSFIINHNKTQNHYRIKIWNCTHRKIQTRKKS